MQYRLDAQHYIDDMLLEPGTVIGDDSGSIAYRYVQDTDDGRGGVAKKGSSRPPSRQMTPLDDEAKKLYADYFGTTAPERDPTKAIPVQGTGSEAKVLPPGAPRPGLDNQYKAPLVNEPDTKPKPMFSPPEDKK